MSIYSLLHIFSNNDILSIHRSMSIIFFIVITDISDRNDTVCGLSECASYVNVR